MANTAQARKRARQALNRRDRNRSQRSDMRTCIKKVHAAIVAGEAGPAQESYRNMTSKVDKMVRKGLIHANKAARYKSRLNAQLKKLVVA
ncbi:MAG: 30S ribosomal protein S20 [Gammaproteobacteria bacterium]|nr:30S ribosomal protein S20 [Gammaproteobacteria bacterium]